MWRTIGRCSPGCSSEQVGVDVTQANNGAEALEAIRAAHPDILFLDVRMPVMDGLSTVRGIREPWPQPHLVCVAITASGLLRPRSHYLDAGFDEFLGKPFLFAAVCDCLECHLGVQFIRTPMRVPAQPREGAYPREQGIVCRRG
jgi:CheY-like chemotaxis protein